MTAAVDLPASELSFASYRDWREANNAYLAALYRTLSRLSQAEHDAWLIADDDERRTVVAAAHNAAVVEADRLRARYEAEAAAMLPRLVQRAFVPWAGEPADRSAHTALVEEIDARVSTEADAYHELHEASRHRATAPHGPLAVYLVAYRRGWRDLVALGRYEGAFPAGKYGPGPIAAVLDFEANALSAATFAIRRPLALQ